MRTATEACVEYERWASEVGRLTRELGAISCPNEGPQEDDGFAWRKSCFQEARDDRANWKPEGAENPPHPPSLAEIAKLVADCPECSKLCRLIAERKHARQRFGVAKRLVRAVGRREPTPAPTQQEDR